MKFTILMAVMAFFISVPAQANDFDETIMPKLKNAQDVIIGDITGDAMMEIVPVRAVAFHSDNCGSCKILGPRLMEVSRVIDTDKFEIIKFDMTNKKSISETKQLAMEKNVDNILEKYGKKTGFIVLVNDQGEQVDILKVDHDVDEMTAKVKLAIENAA